MTTDANSGGIEDRMAEVVLWASFPGLIYSLSIEMYDSQFFNFLQEQHEELACVPAVSSMVQSIRDSFAEDRRGICKVQSWSSS